MIKIIADICTVLCFFGAMGIIGTIEITGDLSNAPAVIICMIGMLIFRMIGVYKKWED